MTADTPPSELVERLQDVWFAYGYEMSLSGSRWKQEAAEALSRKVLNTIAALIHDNARYIETNASLATENATLLRERDAQAKVIALADEMLSCGLSHYHGMPDKKDCRMCKAMDAFADARAGLNTQGSGNG